MSQAVIKVDKLSKRYRLGQTQTLRQRLAAMVSTGAKKAAAQSQPKDFWALRDVSFEVEPGKVLGIIGHNGAGKSTLLKLLSRITDPTSGSATIQGRVASLLEVGTGFHPELTGFVGGTFAGAIDTRALVGLLDSEDPNAICDLVEETVGISCEDCGGGENFCLGIVAEDVSGNYLDNIVGGLTPRSCVDVIDDATCGNGSYTLDGEDNGEIDPLLCPDWQAPTVQ